MMSHHEHNWAEQIPKIVGLLQSGSSVAVVSDAGTPGISDPGAQLADACLAQNIPVHPIPGPSAVVAALSCCGFQASEFSFFGFLPVKGKERASKMQRLINTPCTVVFFEAPHRIEGTFQELSELGQGDRMSVCCRELTKVKGAHTFAFCGV
jgi:16S rRNA (cytidine1402-2'-O)-methyltransferase